MGDDSDDGQSGKVPWRNVVLWMCASAILGLTSYEYGQSEYIKQMRDEQVRNTHRIQQLADQHGDVLKRIEMIETTKTDKRFRSDDWDRERRVLDQEFKSVWKAIEDCRKPTNR